MTLVAFRAMTFSWEDYPVAGQWDELVRPDGRARVGAGRLLRTLLRLDPDELALRQGAADLAIKAMGITFTVYHQEEGSIDRAWPLDIIPRIIALREWQKIERGLAQRVRALNAFIDDVYHDREIVKAGRFPAAYLENSANYRPQCQGVSPPLGIWAHICGSDLVRAADWDITLRS